MKKYLLILLCAGSIKLFSSDHNAMRITSLKNDLKSVKESSKRTSIFNIVMNSAIASAGIASLAGIYFDQPASTIAGSLLAVILESGQIAFNCIHCCQNNENDHDEK